MPDNGQNRREHRRVYFTRDQVFEATLSSSKAEDIELQVKILNLSEGGLFFINNKKSKISFNPGETLFLESIGGPCPTTFPEKIVLEIKWITSDAGLEYSGYGCEFVNLSVQKSRIIRDIVTHYLGDSTNN